MTEAAVRVLVKGVKRKVKSSSKKSETDKIKILKEKIETYKKIIDTLQDENKKLSKLLSNRERLIPWSFINKQNIINIKNRMKQKNSVFNLKDYKKTRANDLASSTSSITKRLLEKYKPSRSVCDIARASKRRGIREAA